MKLGVFTPVFDNLSFDEMIAKAEKLGLQAVEIGTGGNPGTAHLKIDDLLASSEKRKEYLAKLDAHGLEISALSCHNNPISPIKEVAQTADETLRKTIRLAELMNVPVVNEFSGISISALSCHNNPISPIKEVAQTADETLRKTIRLAELMNVPVVNEFSGISAGNDTDKGVSWPTLPWPTEYTDVYNYQWEKKLIPYWKDINHVAENSGVKIGIELHGGFLCHTPYTMLKLREATGNAIGCNLDPSHMWWQGIDPVAAIKILGKAGALHHFHAKDTYLDQATGNAIGCNLDPSHMWWQGIDPVAAIKILGKAGALHHFHAKDTYLDQDNINMYGLTDMQPYSNVQTRAWTFRSVGYGHDLKTWSDMMSALRLYGYDHVVSIEHEDPLMSVDEGLQAAVRNLQSVLIKETPGDMWWTGDTI